jgi:hypothetical protein
MDKRIQMLMMMLLANLFAIDRVALNRHADAFKSFGLRGNTARQGVTHSDSGFSRCRSDFGGIRQQPLHQN